VPVLLQHPQIETAAGVVRATPGRDLGQERSASAPPLVLGSDVDVVEKRSPSLIVATISVGKADQVILLLREDDELIRRRRRQPLLPDANLERPPLKAVEDALASSRAVVATSAVSAPVICSKTRWKICFLDSK
jgi:hypothetical protein